MSEQHFHNITRMMQAFGQDTPQQPVVPPKSVLLARIKMLQEEMNEFVDACGFALDPFTGEYHDIKEADLVEMVDAMADIQVVNTGSAVACGIYLPGIVDLVDQNNMLKVAGGHLDEKTGKFIKPPNHPKPDIRGEINRQIEDAITL